MQDVGEDDMTSYVSQTTAVSSTIWTNNHIVPQKSQQFAPRLPQ